ncbi:MAG: hypothetical protein C0483_04520 [Pirellula sp.]|nr:hypothetical protein [Pirellula sp.]
MQVGCPRCPALVNVPVTMAGQMVVCPTCGLSYQVPGYAAPAAPMPPPPQYGALQYPAPQYPAPPYMAPPYVAPPYGAVPQPPVEYPPLFAAPTAMPQGAPAAPQQMPPSQPLLPPAPAAAQPAAPPTGLKPVAVLAPPPIPGSAKPDSGRPRWQHEKRSQSESARPTKAEDSPTSMLPPSATKEFRAAASDMPAGIDDAKKPLASPAPNTASSTTSSSKPPSKTSSPSAANPASNIPDSAFPRLPGAGEAASPPEPHVAGPARMDLSAVEERLALARRKTQTTIAVALFGLVAMTLFAWFVVNLSRPH